MGRTVILGGNIFQVGGPRENGEAETRLHLFTGVFCSK